MDVRKVALKALIKIIEKKSQADVIINKYSENVEYPTELHRLVSGVVKHKLTLDYFIESISSRKIKDMSYQVINVLRLGIFELEFLKNPDYAVINSYVEIIKTYDKKLGAFINAILRNFLRKHNSINFPDINKFPQKHISIKYSHPEWMVGRWIETYGIENTIKICEYNNSVPKLVLRVNTLKISKVELLKLFDADNIEYKQSKLVKDCIIVNYHGNIQNIAGYKEGYWLVQGESSSIVSLVLDPREGDNILDLCAAPGGKTVHIAALINNIGKIKAVDINAKRLDKVKGNCDRLGISCIDTVVADSTSYYTDDKYDKILVDAPCSNTGVLVKRVDARWNKSFDDVKNLSLLQFNILNNAAKLLKVGGVIVYSTCSIEPEENKLLAEAFLKENKNFDLDKMFSNLDLNIQKDCGYYQILQSEHDIDGFFIAKFKKLSD